MWARESEMGPVSGWASTWMFDSNRARLPPSSSRLMKAALPRSWSRWGWGVELMLPVGKVCSSVCLRDSVPASSDRKDGWPLCRSAMG